MIVCVRFKSCTVISTTSVGRLKALKLFFFQWNTVKLNTAVYIRLENLCSPSVRKKTVASPQGPVLLVRVWTSHQAIPAWEPHTYKWVNDWSAAAGDHTVNKQQQQCEVISFVLLFWIFPFLWITVLLPYTVCCVPSPCRPHTQPRPSPTNAQTFSRGDKQASLQTLSH